MKKFALIFLVLLLLLSAAACEKTPVTEDLPPAETEDVGDPLPSKAPAEDPAVTYTTEEVEAAEIYEKTGIYFFAPDTVSDVKYSLIGGDELDAPIAEMSFVTKDTQENDFAVTYRVHKDDMINADQAGVLFGEPAMETRNTISISNNVATILYDEGGEAVVFWYDTVAGYNCCVRFADCSDREAVLIYSNLLYAFIHSDIKPEN